MDRGITNNGFSLTIEFPRSRWAVLGQFLSAALLYLGLSGSLWVTLRLGEIGVNPLPLAAVGLIYCLLGCGLSKKMWLARLLSIIAIVVYMLLAGRNLIEGFNITFNHMYTLFERWTGYIFPRYEVMAQTGHELYSGLFLALPSALLAVLAGRMFGGGRIWALGALIFAAALWVAAIAGFYSPGLWGLMFSAGLAALYSRKYPHKGSRMGSDAIGSALLCQIIIFLLLGAVPLLLISADAPEDAGAVRNQAERLISRLRFGVVDGVLPEGDFINLGSFEPSEQEMIMLRMEVPAEIYMRGFVGEVYTGMGWESLETEQRGYFAPLFSWLRENDFFGQSQHSRLLRALGENTQGRTVDVSVLNARTVWRYAPYEILFARANPRRIGDETIYARGLRGEREYSFMIAERSISDHEELNAQLSARRQAGDAAAIEYLLIENAFREYVYANFLYIPESTKAAISDFLSLLELPEQGRISFRDAQMVVSAFLSDGLTFTEHPDTIDSGSDFAIAFLTQTRQGHNVHFATAATLLFRYLGFPARYVEGFHVSEAAANSVQDGQPLILDETFALAWAEVYRDGIGFVPFEIVPPLTEPEHGGGGAGGGGGGGGAELPEEEPDAIRRSILFPLLMALLLALLISVSALVIRRYMKRRRLVELLSISDCNAAVSNMTAWTVILLGHMGISRQGGSLYDMEKDVELRFGTGMGFRNMVDVQRRALFSREGVTERETAVLKVFMDETEAALKQNGRWYGRLRLRWIECVI